MYCSFCGTALTPGLSYCSRCGAELNEKGRSVTSFKEVESLVWAIVVVTVVGLGGIIGLMAVMKEALHFNDNLIVAFSLLFFLTFLAVDGAFLSLLLRSEVGAGFPERFPQTRIPSTNDLGEPRPSALAEPASSVTEHTTRTMDPVRSGSNTG
jgi:predicted nucleic acid-binding Zn ribbon protein